MAQFRCAAVIFDLDGVLADSTAAVNRAWEVWASRHGVDPLHAIRTGHGRTTIDAVRELAPRADAQRSFEEMEALEEAFAESVIPVRGAPEFVARVAALAVPWAVATSSSRRIAIPRLQRCGIPLPRVLVSGDDVRNGKPDPEPYQKAAAGLGLPADRCVVFEDAPSGMLSARQAGATVVGISMGSALYDGAYASASAHDFREIEISRTSEEALACVSVCK